MPGIRGQCSVQEILDSPETEIVGRTPWSAADALVGHLRWSSQLSSRVIADR